MILQGAPASISCENSHSVSRSKLFGSSLSSRVLASFRGVVTCKIVMSSRPKEPRATRACCIPAVPDVAFTKTVLSSAQHSLSRSSNSSIYQSKRNTSSYADSTIRTSGASTPSCVHNILIACVYRSSCF